MPQTNSAGGCMKYRVDYIDTEDRFRTKEVTLDALDPVLTLEQDLLRAVKLIDPTARKIWQRKELTGEEPAGSKKKGGGRVCGCFL